MSNSVLAAQVRARTWMDSVKNHLAESEAGQGAAEYAGVIVIAAIIVGVIIAAIGDGNTIQTAVEDAIKEILNQK
ncbi:hypothetical protein [Actinomyces qiguomingii]|uniref:hypothetical protein n=1 Tax=Actinomyces qiguomingii TaxID=2057800 RepID=UPI000CA01CB5|nr:hypothetical protein [Actinomyces qiguomingii]